MFHLRELLIWINGMRLTKDRMLITTAAWGCQRGPIGLEPSYTEALTGAVVEVGYVHGHFGKQPMLMFITK